MYADPSGYVSIKDAFQWFIEKVVEPAMDFAENVGSKIDLTKSNGFTFSASPSFWTFSVQFGYSIDTKGNVAAQWTISAGLTTGTPSASLGFYNTFTNASSIYQLEGMGVQIGGSTGIIIDGFPLYLSDDINIIPDSEAKKMYFGLTQCAGVGTPGEELHVEWGNTRTIKQTQFNIFRVMDELCQRMLED